MCCCHLNCCMFGMAAFVVLCFFFLLLLLLCCDVFGLEAVYFGVVLPTACCVVALRGDAGCGPPGASKQTVGSASQAGRQGKVDSDLT